MPIKNTKFRLLDNIKHIKNTFGSALTHHFLVMFNKTLMKLGEVLMDVLTLPFGSFCSKPMLRTKVCIYELNQKHIWNILNLISQYQLKKC